MRDHVRSSVQGDLSRRDTPTASVTRNECYMPLARGFPIAAREFEELLDYRPGREHLRDLLVRHAQDIAHDQLVVLAE